MPKNNNSDRWISLQEVSKYPGVKRHAILGCVEQGGIPASKVGKLWRFKTADIDGWVGYCGASHGREGME